jgi:hypothetical protein
LNQEIHSLQTFCCDEINGSWSGVSWYPPNSNLLLDEYVVEMDMMREKFLSNGAIWYVNAAAVG